MAGRNRLSISFSKKYSREYELILKENNASELICELLKKHYEGDITNKDIMNRINELFSNLSNININIDEDLDEAIDSWD